MERDFVFSNPKANEKDYEWDPKFIGMALGEKMDDINKGKFELTWKEDFYDVWTQFRGPG